MTLESRSTAKAPDAVTGVPPSKLDWTAKARAWWTPREWAWLAVAAPIGAGVALFALFLFVPLPLALAYGIKRGSFPFVAMVAVLMYALLWGRSRAARIASVAVGMGIFALPLAALWHGALSDGSAIAGLLPFSDAGVYFTEANSLLAGRGFGAFAARRPIFTGVLAALLGIADGNLRLVVAVFGIAAGLGAMVATRALRRTEGPACAAGFFGLILLFYARFAGTALTEQLGVPLGLLAFAMLWRSAAGRHAHLALAGLFVLTVALNVRAGAFFVLPLLALWIAIDFRAPAVDKRLSRRLLGWGVVAIVAGFFSNWLLFKLLAAPGAMPFSNFSYTLYGVASGGTSWQQVLVVHPELAALPESVRAQRVFSLAVDLIASHPGGLIRGAWRALYQMALPLGNGVFSFVNSARAQYVVYAFAVLGIYRCVLRRKEPTNRLLLWATAGIVLSVPFVPPWDAEAMRAYAATIPIMMTIPALGLAAAGDLLPTRRISASATTFSTDHDLLRWGVAVTVLGLLLPLATRAIARPRHLPVVICATGETAAVVRVRPGSFISLVAEGQPEALGVVRASTLRAGIKGLGPWYPEVDSTLAAIAAPAMVAVTSDLRSGRGLWLAAPTDLASHVRKPTAVCGRQWPIPGLGTFFNPSLAIPSP
jgi:hypothetical protein